MSAGRRRYGDDRSLPKGEAMTTSSSARTATQNFPTDLPGNVLWMTSASQDGNHAPRAPRMTRGVSRASGNWHAAGPFSKLFD
eukprot:7662540-Pyramimonas_sp.AAC.1